MVKDVSPQDDRSAQNGPKWLSATTPNSKALIPPISAARWLMLLIVIAGVFFFHGFVVPVLAALVIAFASWPLYKRILTQVSENTTIGASIALVLILTFLIVPISIAVAYTVGELRLWIGWALEVNRVGAPAPDWVMGVPRIGPWLAEQWAKYIGPPKAIGELVQMVSGANIGNIYRILLAASESLFHLVLMLLFMLITLFFVFRDGSKFSQQLDLLGEYILPNRWERISRVVPATVSSTVTGMTLIAMGEGIVLGTAYWLAGVPSPVTLGLLTGIMALVPGGAPVSFTLVSIYLIGKGSYFAGIALLAWGTTELFIVDKTLRPRLVGGPIKLPFLPTFFGLVGGVKTMGFLGLFIGPVLMALIVSIWREWIHEFEFPQVIHKTPLEPNAEALEPERSTIE